LLVAHTSLLASIPEALAELQAGRMVILVDDEDRENEGDLVLPAQFVTPEAITFMLTVARGYLCLSMTEHDCDRLQLHPQSSLNTSSRGTAFTVSIDLHPRHGGTTGVSAKERARCVQMAIDPAFGPSDFVRPGHINPLRARNGGTLVRMGQTEGSIDLCKLAGLYPAATIIEIMRDDGEMARLPDLLLLAEKHKLKVCSVAQLIEYRLSRESMVRRVEPVAGTPIRTAYGTFNLIAYETPVDPLPHIAIVQGSIGQLDGTGKPRLHAEPVLVRMHRRNLLGDIFMQTDGEGRASAHTLHESMRRIAQAGQGAIVYLRGEGELTSSKLHERLQARRTNSERASDDHGLKLSAPASGTYPTESVAASAQTVAPTGAPVRELGIGCQILRDLGITNIDLLTSHTMELPALEAFGLSISRQTTI